MDESLKHQWIEWANQHDLDPRLKNFMYENPQYLTNAMSADMILETSKFLKRTAQHSAPIEKVAKGLQLVLAMRPQLAEFGAKLADYLEQNPVPEDIHQDVHPNPVKELDQKLPNRDTYIKKDEVTNMVIGLETCKTEEDFNNWLKAM